MLSTTDKLAAIQKLTKPALPSGAISHYDADLVLQAGNSIPVIRPFEPVTEVLPVAGERAILLDDSGNGQLPGSSVEVVTNQGFDPMAWAKANPVPAIAIAGVAAFIIYELTKRK